MVNSTGTVDQPKSCSLDDNGLCTECGRDYCAGELAHIAPEVRVCDPKRTLYASRMQATL